MTRNFISNWKYDSLMPPYRLPQFGKSNVSSCYPFGIPKSMEITTENNGTPFKISDINSLSNIGIRNNFISSIGNDTATFDKIYCESIGGYPKDAILLYNDSRYGFVYLQSLIDDNTYDFTENGIDENYWKIAGNATSVFDSNATYAHLIGTAYIPKSDLIGENNNKWYRAISKYAYYYGALYRTFTNLDNVSGKYSFDTVMEVSLSQEETLINPDELLANPSKYPNTTFEHRLYISNCYAFSNSRSYQITSSTNGTMNFSYNDVYYGNYSNLFVSPGMYYSLWVRNNNYYTSETSTNICTVQVYQF